MSKSKGSQEHKLKIAQLKESIELIQLEIKLEELKQHLALLCKERATEDGSFARSKTESYSESVSIGESKGESQSSSVTPNTPPAQKES